MILAKSGPSAIIIEAKLTTSSRKHLEEVDKLHAIVTSNYQTIEFL